MGPPSNKPSPSPGSNLESHLSPNSQRTVNNENFARYLRPINSPYNPASPNQHPNPLLDTRTTTNSNLVEKSSYERLLRDSEQEFPQVHNNTVIQQQSQQQDHPFTLLRDSLVFNHERLLQNQQSGTGPYVLHANGAAVSVTSTSPDHHHHPSLNSLDRSNNYVEDAGLIDESYDNFNIESGNPKLYSIHNKRTIDSFNIPRETPKLYSVTTNGGPTDNSREKRGWIDNSNNGTRNERRPIQHDLMNTGGAIRTFPQDSLFSPEIPLSGTHASIHLPSPPTTPLQGLHKDVSNKSNAIPVTTVYSYKCDRSGNHEQSQTKQLLPMTMPVTLSPTPSTQPPVVLEADEMNEEEIVCQRRLYNSKNSTFANNDENHYHHGGSNHNNGIGNSITRMEIEELQESNADTKENNYGDAVGNGLQMEQHAQENNGYLNKLLEGTQTDADMTLLATTPTYPNFGDYATDEDFDDDNPSPTGQPQPVFPNWENLKTPDPTYLKITLPPKYHTFLANSYKKDCRSWLWKNEFGRRSRALLEGSTAYEKSSQQQRQQQRNSPFYCYENQENLSGDGGGFGNQGIPQNYEDDEELEKRLAEESLIGVTPRRDQAYLQQREAADFNNPLNKAILIGSFYFTFSTQLLHFVKK